MTTPDTRKPSIWKYFDHIDRDKTFSTAICKFCDFSTHYSTNTSSLRNHLSRHKDRIIQLEAETEDSNPNVSNHNCTEETGYAAAIVEAVYTTQTQLINPNLTQTQTSSNYNYKRLIKTEIMRHAELLFQAPTVEIDSPNSIRAFINHIRTNLDSLKWLNVPVDTWDIPVILHIRAKLDENTLLQYNETLKSDDIPNLNQLLEFLAERARGLDTKTHYSISNHENATNSQRSSAQGCNDVRREQQFDDSRHQRSSSPRPSTSQSQTVHQSSSRPLIPRPSSSRPSSPHPSTTRPASSRPSSRHSPSSYSPSRRLRSRSPISTRRIECPICKTNEHNIHHCRTFCKWTASQRVKTANYYKLCLNCLRPDHHTSTCRSRKCRECKQRHHSLLHTDNHPITQWNIRH